MRRGLALVLVVGVLGVLAVLGSAFAVLSRLERRAAALRVQGTQALLLARSGMEDARARLDAGQDPAYGGEDWDGSNSLSPGIETAAEVYRPGFLDTDACPVRQALRPSFFVASTTDLGADLRPAPRRIPADSRERGYSGGLASGNWAIRTAPAGGFHVNGGNPAILSDPTVTSNYNTNLQRMFGILSDAIDREDGTADGSPVSAADGENLIALRPTSGWLNLDQLRETALGGSQAKLEALEGYLSLFPCVDYKVVQPNMREAHLDREFGLQMHLRRGYYVDPMALIIQTSARRVAPIFPRIGSSPRNLGRAPVSLPWARTRRPALVALLAGLRGFYFQEYEGTWDMWGCGGIGYLRNAELTLDWSQPSDEVRIVADSFLQSTSELATWEQFHAFCDSLPIPAGTSELGQGKKDLLKANFNPNSALVKFNPDPSLTRLMDKTDLRIQSTELNLAPESGWKVSVVGRVSNGTATRILQARTSPDRSLKLTTQSDFVAENLGNPFLPGDESGFRSYGSAPYITPSTGLGKTFGHTLPGSPSTGVSLQTYPEPHPVWTPPASGRPALWDGQIRLATIETSDGEYAQGGTMRFLARWDDSFHGDYGGGPLTSASQDSLQGLPTDSLWPATTAVSKPNNLHPDGPYLETYGFPSFYGFRLTYVAAGNLSPKNGTISYWFKPSYDTSKHQGAGGNYRRRIHLDNSRVQTVIGPSPPLPPNTSCNATACFFITAYGLKGSSYWNGQQEQGLSQFWENYFYWDSSNDARDEQARSVTPPEVRHRWYLLTSFWDMQTLRAIDATDPSSRILLDRGLDPWERNTAYAYANEFNNPVTATSVDFTQPAGSCFTVGGASGAVIDLHPNSYPGPEATLDEFAIYDLGLATGAEGDGIDLSERMAQNRYEAGRYYKGDDGAWFSAPIDLGGSRIRSLSWTQIVPRGLRAPAAAVREDGDDGPDGRIVLDLRDASGLAAAIDRVFTDPRGERIGRRLAPFRLRAVFQPRLADPLGKAILDPLTLDDVTVTYRPVDAPAMADWREGE